MPTSRLSKICLQSVFQPTDTTCINHLCLFANALQNSLKPKGMSPGCVTQFIFMHFGVSILEKVRRKSYHIQSLCKENLTMTWKLTRCFWSTNKTVQVKEEIWHIKLWVTVILCFLIMFISGYVVRSSICVSRWTCMYLYSRGINGKWLDYKKVLWSVDQPSVVLKAEVSAYWLAGYNVSHMLLAVTLALMFTSLK